MGGVDKNQVHHDGCTMSVTCGNTFSSKAGTGRVWVRPTAKPCVGLRVCWAEE